MTTARSGTSPLRHGWLPLLTSDGICKGRHEFDREVSFRELDSKPSLAVAESSMIEGSKKSSEEEAHIWVSFFLPWLDPMAHTKRYAFDLAKRLAILLDLNSLLHMSRSGACRRRRHI